MKIKKGHLTGFFSTIIIFGIVFFYIYTGTMESSWIYNINNKTKTKIGKNIIDAKFSHNEEYLAYSTLNGTLKLFSSNDLKNPIITKQNINYYCFAKINNKPNLIFINKDGETFLYDFNQTKNLEFNCFNEYVYEYNSNIYSLSSKKVSIYDLNTNKKHSFNIDFNNASKDNIYNNKTLICIFHKDKLQIIDLIKKTDKTINIKDYCKYGIYEDENIIYLNSDGKININSKIINIKPYKIIYKDKKLYFATKDKTYCYDTNGNEIWCKEMMSAFFDISNKGDVLVSSYKNTCAFYDTATQKEKFSINGKKSYFSPKDNFLFVTEKSQF